MSDRPTGELTIIAAGLAAVIAPDRVPEVLVNEDLRRELQRNHPLRESPREKQDEYRVKLRQSTAQRARLLRDKTVKSLLLMLSAVAAGWVFHALFSPFVTKHPVLFSLLSALSFAWGTVGRMGWQGQTIAGTTTIERLDAFFLRALYWLGMFFVTTAIL